MTDYTPQDYIQYRIAKANETIKEVRIHIENGFWNTAINRMYYACFYAVSALLAKDKVDVSSHSGVRQKFGENFVKAGIIDRDLAKHFTELHEKRNKGDYNDFYDYDEEAVLRLYPVSQRFIEEITKILDN